MRKEIKVFAIFFLVCVVGHGMFWTGFFVDKITLLWFLYGIFSILSILALGGLLLAILTD